jgi:oligopeptide transport system ATP-binding protein
MTADGLDGAPGFDRALPALRVQDLHVELQTPAGPITPAKGVSLEVTAGRTLAVLGESGSGKSITARAVMGVLPRPSGRVVSGQVLVHGVDLLAVPAGQRRRVRGSRIAIVFQDALSSLNPVLPVGYQIAETIRAHRRMPRAQLKRKVTELLELVRIPGAQRRARDYPHQFSGGMRQRAAIAMALALDPEVLIADEPTTALDVTVQAQIIGLLGSIQAERQMGLMLITHDMAVAAEIADSVAVMYAGRVVETGALDTVYRRPAHPYTRALLGCIPRQDGRAGPLTAIGGAPPDLARLPEGCAFRPRCSYAEELCRTRPPIHQVTADRQSACHRWQEVIGA